MKISTSIAVMALAVITLTGCKNETPVATDTATTNQSEQPAVLATATFTIEGMHCEVGCAGHLEKKLAKLDGVKKADIDFEAKKATVEYDTNLLTPEIIVQTVEGAADGKTYKVSDVMNSADEALGVTKDKKKKKNQSQESKSENQSQEPKASCTSGEKKACCASKMKTT
ncbi:heavy-metal-associated domain-containing protein [Flavobacterium sp.]|uniref:heavy-metal-associated domain-containing protein n=1 Tax=Flavobacterium sp. TaxID=239 RepID=UPI002FDB0B72